MTNRSHWVYAQRMLNHISLKKVGTIGEGAEGGVSEGMKRAKFPEILPMHFLTTLTCLTEIIFSYLFGRFLSYHFHDPFFQR